MNNRELEVPANGKDQVGLLTSLISRSPLMREVFSQVRRSAQVNSTVLVTGESGTGKELIARALHENSPRAAGPLVTVNMAAIPELLVESELFGHVKGSFTGADGNRTGRFEAARRGTVFIDEIGDLPLPSQATLLRVLENHKVTPVGSNVEREVDVRVIAATHRRLEKMVQEKRFREDLYYRLNVVRISLPPLRERPEDIPILAQHFADECCRMNHKPQPRLAAGLLAYLQAHPWPGKVRQLRNCMESMVVLARSATLRADDLPPSLRNGSSHAGPRFEIPDGMTLAEVERAAILHTLDRRKSNRTRTAKQLGISVRTLQRKLAGFPPDSLGKLMPAS